MFKRLPDVQPRLADDVYEQILSAIVNGQIAPGERLIQEKIAAEINIKDIELLKIRGADLNARGGRLWLQDHGQDVWFRNLRIRVQ